MFTGLRREGVEITVTEFTIIPTKPTLTPLLTSGTGIRSLEVNFLQAPSIFHSPSNWEVVTCHLLSMVPWVILST